MWMLMDPSKGLIQAFGQHSKQLGLPLLAYGGFSQADQIESILKQPGVAAAVIGNALNYQEDSIRMLKDQLSGLPLRPHPNHPSSTNH